jgi:hypothetical protein
MKERDGWVLLTIGIVLFALDWLVLVLASFMYGTKLGEMLF